MYRLVDIIQIHRNITGQALDPEYIMIMLVEPLLVAVQ